MTKRMKFEEMRFEGADETLELPDDDAIQVVEGPGGMVYTLGKFTTTQQALSSRVRWLMQDVTYNREGDWEIRLLPDAEFPRGRIYLQVGHWRRDVDTGSMGWGYGGKAYLSKYATDSEIIQILFGLFRAYEEHECREAFTFKSRRVFGPHLDVTKLHRIADSTDTRPAPAETKEES